MMLQVEHGGQQLTSESPVHPLRTDASSGVGNSSAQTVDAHVPREWEEPASEALREGWSEAEVCAEEVAAPREPMRLQRGRACRSREAAPTPSGSSYRQGRRKAPSGSSSTAQSTASSRGNCRHGGRDAASGRATCRTSSIGTSNQSNQQHRDEQPVEPAPSGGATYRTSSIGKSTFCQIMVPKGQVLRG